MKLKCVFFIGEGDDESYTCTVNSATITEPNKAWNKEVKSIQGTHMYGKSNADVKSIFFQDTNVKYFPRGLHNIFPGLTRLDIDNCGLKAISRADLVGLENLKELVLHSNELTSIPNNLFQDTQNLKIVSFSNNKLERLSSKLLKPLLTNQMTYVGFRNNTRIDSLFTYDGKDGSVGTLKELMDIIDKQCESPTWRHEKTSKVGSEELWTSGLLSDFTIIAGKQSFKVHISILAIQSSVFMEKFKDESKTETREGKLVIKEFSSKVVEEFLRYIYTGEIPEAPYVVTYAMNLFAIAAKFGVPGFKEEFEETILKNLDVSNAFEVLVLGNLHGSENMKKIAFIELKKMFPEHEISDEMMNQPERLKVAVEAKRELDRISAALG